MVPPTTESPHIDQTRASQKSVSTMSGSQGTKDISQSWPEQICVSNTGKAWHRAGMWNKGTAQVPSKCLSSNECYSPEVGTLCGGGWRYSSTHGWSLAGAAAEGIRALVGPELEGGRLCTVLSRPELQ